MPEAEKEDEERTLSELHQYTHKKIDYISSKMKIAEKEVYQTAKEFFKELLKLDYEFTHEELIEELQKKYLDKDKFQRLVKFITRIGQMEYTKKEFTQKELKSLLIEMKEILDLLIQHEARKKGFLEKILNKLHLKKEEQINEINTKKLEQIEEEVEKEEKEIDKINKKENKEKQVKNNLPPPQQKPEPTPESHPHLFNTAWPRNVDKQDPLAEPSEELKKQTIMAPVAKNQENEKSRWLED